MQNPGGAVIIGAAEAEGLLWPKKGTGILIMWAEIPAELEDELRRWYDEEHLAEVMAVPGVLNAARYEATSSGPKHLVVYELESPAVVESEAWTSRPRTEWGKTDSPQRHRLRLHQQRLRDDSPGPAHRRNRQQRHGPALQIGRMDVPAENDAEWNEWYSGVYVPNYEKVPGCIRGRRVRAVRGSPAYATVYEFEDENVSQTEEWLRQREIHPDNQRMRDIMTHAPGSPGIWKKAFQL